MPQSESCKNHKLVVIYYTSKLLSCLTNYFKLAKAGLHICIIVPNFIYCIPVILVTTVILFVTVIPVILAIQFIPVILVIPVIR